MSNPSQTLYSGQEIPEVESEKIALLCVDMQYHDAAPNFGFFEGTPREAHAYYFDRLDNTVFPTVARLQKLFREQRKDVIHARICSLTQDGRDRSLEHKRIGCHVKPGSKASEFMPQVAPIEDEIIISKTGSGVFNTTNIDYILRNLGVTQIVIVGVLTNECIETAVRDGADRGYTMYMVEEGMAAMTPALHEASLNVLSGVYGYQITVDQLETMLTGQREA